jgi:hypothetical protein
MSGIYIPGIEMPKEGMCKTITIFDDGAVVEVNGSEKLGIAVHIPPHGRLIDADEACRRFPVDADPRNGYMLYKLNNELPTIIPADPIKEEAE